MKQLYILLLLFATLPLSVVAKKDDIRHIRYTYEYKSDNPDESQNEALKNAFQRAREKALEKEFGLNVNSINSHQSRTTTRDGKTQSSSDNYSVSETELRGEWLETIEEKVLQEPVFQNGFWQVKVYVEGKAREKSSALPEIRWSLVRHEDDTQPATTFQDGDRFFLRFASPVSGSLCVYLADAAGNVACLLPYGNRKDACQTIEADREYLFFSDKTDKTIPTYNMTCDGETEQNTLYVVFSPNPFVKAATTDASYLSGMVLRFLPFKNFQRWLDDNRIADKDLVVKKDIITITKKQ